MERDTPLPRINPRAAPDISPPTLPDIPLRNVPKAPKPTPMAHRLRSASGPVPKTKPTFGFTKPNQATRMYKATPFDYRA
jgi:hypothetical protein